MKKATTLLAAAIVSLVAGLAMRKFFAVLLAVGAAALLFALPVWAAADPSQLGSKPNKSVANRIGC